MKRLLAISIVLVGLTAGITWLTYSLAGSESNDSTPIVNTSPTSTKAPTDRNPPTSTSEPTSEATSEPPILYFPTQVPDIPFFTSVLPGQLVVRGGCLAMLSALDQMTYPIVWPHGYQWRVQGDGTIQILDQTNRVVVRVGDTIKLGGGQGRGIDVPCSGGGFVWYAGLDVIFLETTESD